MFFNFFCFARRHLWLRDDSAGIYLAGVRNIAEFPLLPTHKRTERGDCATEFATQKALLSESEKGNDASFFGIDCLSV